LEIPPGLMFISQFEIAKPIASGHSIPRKK
jgi:hypothetical protein